MKIFLLPFTVLLSLVLSSQVTLTKDTSFGNNGIVEFNTGASVRIIFSDNSILCSSGDKLTKLTPNGNIDTGFGNTGVLELSNETNNWFYITKQGEKFIVVYGPTFPTLEDYTNSRAVRYNSNGTLDTTFADNGTLNQSFELDTQQSRPLLVLADNSILINQRYSSLKKYTQDGQPDLFYGNNGSIAYSGSIPIGYINNTEICAHDFDLYGTYFSFPDYQNPINSTSVDLRSTIFNPTNNLSYNYCSYNGISVKTNNNEKTYALFSLWSTNSSFLNEYGLVVFNNESLDTAVNGNGYIKLFYEGDDTNAIEPFSDVVYTQNQFFIVGSMGKGTQNPYTYSPLLLSYNSTGGQQTVNGNNLYIETDFPNGNFDSVLAKDNYLLILGHNSATLKSVIIKYTISNSSLSTQDPQTDNELKVTNPFTDQLQIIYAKNLEKAEIYTLEGRLLLTTQNTEINTSGLNKGVYILKIYLKNGKIISKKIIRK